MSRHEQYNPSDQELIEILHSYWTVEAIGFRAARSAVERAKHLRQADCYMDEYNDIIREQAGRNAGDP
jgi:hypothetical protein